MMQDLFGQKTNDSFNLINFDIFLLWVEATLIVLILFGIILWLMLRIAKKVVPDELYKLRDLINKLREEDGKETETNNN